LYFINHISPVQYSCHLILFTENNIKECKHMEDYGIYWGSNPGLGKRFFSSPQCPDMLWGPPSLLSKGYGGFSPGEVAGA
jgi:hypothetical protein